MGRNSSAESSFGINVIIYVHQLKQIICVLSANMAIFGRSLKIPAKPCFLFFFLCGKITPWTKAKHYISSVFFFAYSSQPNDDMYTAGLVQLVCTSSGESIRRWMVIPWLCPTTSRLATYGDHGTGYIPYHSGIPVVFLLVLNVGNFREWSTG